MADDLVIGMAGAGGDGVVSAGESLITAAALEGYHAILTKSFGPQIRGGESSCRLRIATRAVYPGRHARRRGRAELGRLPALRRRAAGRRGDDRHLRRGVRDGTRRVSLAGVRPAELVAVPIARLAKAVRVGQSQEHRGPRAAGGVARVCSRSAPGRHPPQVREEGAEVLGANERAFAAGRSYAADKPLPAPRRLAAG